MFVYHINKFLDNKSYQFSWIIPILNKKISDNMVSRKVNYK